MIDPNIKHEILHAIKSILLIVFILGSVCGYAERNKVICMIFSILSVILFIYMWFTTKNEDIYKNKENYGNN